MFSLDAQAQPPFENCTDCAGCDFPAVANNPDLNVQCQEGFNIAFILDESGSIATPASSPAPQQVRDGVLTFLENLNCTDVNVGFIEFSSAARLVSVTGGSYTPITDGLITNMETYFNGAGLITDPSTYNPADGDFASFFEKGTNWQDAMDKVGDLGTPDMILFFTDGIPTVWGLDQTYDGTTIGALSCNAPTTTQDPEIVNAIDYANYYKGLNTHMFMMGVGTNVDVAQAQLMSGTAEYDVSDPDASFRTTDYLIETDFSLLGERLRAFALDLCPVIATCEPENACSGSADGAVTITVEATATAPFTYTYTGPSMGGGTFAAGSSETVTGLAAGTYTFVVSEGTEPCLRTEECEVTIEDSPSPTCTIEGSTNVTCFGAADGVITISVTGGTAPFDVFVNDVSQGDVTMIGNLMPGDYAVRVVDVNGCESVCGDVSITEPDELMCQTSNPMPETGAGLEDGSFDLGATGGTAPYDYSVDDGMSTVTNGSFGAGGTTVSGLAEGSYTVTVTDANDCETQCDISLSGSIADLRLEKSASNSMPIPGETITYEIVVTNDGPNDATGVAIGDVVPNGLDMISAISNGGMLNGTEVEWTGLSIPFPGSITLSYTAVVQSPTPGTSYVNIAQVTDSDQEDPDSDPDNNDPDEDDQDDEEITVAQADLALMKSASNTMPNACDIITYTITVVNQGPSNATGVSIADVVPNGLSGFTNISNGGMLAGNTITWTGLSIPFPGSIDLTYDAKVEPLAPGNSYTNIAQVTASDQDDPDSDPDNNDPTEDDQDDETIVPLQADLSLMKSASNTTPSIGEIITYTLFVFNDGPGNATGVEIQDEVPNGLTNVTNIDQGGTITGTTITWTGLSIPVGTGINLTYMAEVLPPLPGVTYTNVAQVTESDQFDPDSEPGNNDPDEDDQDDETIAPPVADLSVMKSVSNSAPNVGETITYTVFVFNEGPDDATGVEIQDVVPNGLANVTNINVGGTITGTTITWTGLSIAAGTGINLTYMAEVLPPLPGVTYTNVAQVTESDQFDPDSEPGNNDPDEDDQDDETISPPVADLSLMKSVSNSTPMVGETVTFTLILANEGPDGATNVEITDVVPDGYASISNISNGGTYDGSEITWDGLNVAAGASIPLTYDAVVGIPSGAPGEFLNVAQVTESDQYDPDSEPGNDDPTEDDQDEEEICVLYVDLVDPADLLLTCGQDFDAVVTAWLDAIVQALIDNSISTHDADVEVSHDYQTPVEFACEVGNGTLVTFTVTDDCGNMDTRSALISKLDLLAPVISGVPGDQQFDCGAAVPGLPAVSAVDDCDGDVDVEMVESRDNQAFCGAGFTLTRTYIATDLCGNRSTASYTMNFTDTEAPTLTVAEDLVMQCSNAIPEPEYESGDDCSQTSVVVDEIRTDLNACEYELRRVYTATDACGNRTVREQIITVVDTIPPVVTMTSPGLAGVENGGTVTMTGCEQPEMLVEFADFSDCCQSLVIEPFDIQIASNVCDVFGYYKRYECGYDVTDEAGNTTHFMFYVEQHDITPPEILEVPEDLDLECNALVSAPPELSAVDECSPFADLVFTENIIAPSADSFAVIRTWTAQDLCMNQTSASQIISVCGFDPSGLIGNLGNTIWVDQNANGLQEVNEQGLNGVKIYLYENTPGRSEGVLIDSTISVSIEGVKGKYGFNHRIAGSYELRFELPADHEFTTPDVGVDDQLDSDVNPDNGMIRDIVLTGGSEILNLDAGLINVSAALPVELVSFSADADKCNVDVRWTTASEINVSHFEIQRSTDSRIWQVVGEVEATGHVAAEEDYHFAEIPDSKEMFYRLKMIDLDGSEEYSQILRVNVADCSEHESQLIAFPNPTGGLFTIMSPELEYAELNVRNDLGQLLIQREVGEIDRLELDLSHYPPGIYFVDVKMSKERKVFRVLKQ